MNSNTVKIFAVRKPVLAKKDVSAYNSDTERMQLLFYGKNRFGVEVLYESKEKCRKKTK